MTTYQPHTIHHHASAHVLHTASKAPLISTCSACCTASWLDHTIAHLLQQLDPGAAVARGSPLLVRMFVPLWLVNATNLPIGAVVVATQPPQQSKDPKPEEGGMYGGLETAANSSKLRVMDTKAKPS